MGIYGQSSQMRDRPYEDARIRRYNREDERVQCRSEMGPVDRWLIGYSGVRDRLQRERKTARRITVMSFGKLVALSMLAAFSTTAGYTYLTGSPATATTTASQAVAFKPYSMCSDSVRVHCVVDGDTI